MTTGADAAEIANLNLALRAFRRMLVRLLIVPALVALSWLGHALAPPYGLRILGWSLVEWGLIAILVLIGATVYREGRRIGRALGDPGLAWLSPLTVLSAPGIVARRAAAIGMEWSGFYGPLRPARRR